ncbi:MAG: metallopeptidase family protein [Phycisphaeraceae bacterium]|nr:metallopeptidase family protein [Phycisphaeraceae bacterium]MCW5753352.1 metallopeptidase family protein [Phycisphaeraceae bacterium]
MTESERAYFDELVHEAVEQLPEEFRALLDHVPLVVVDEPTSDILRDLGLDPRDEQEREELLGLHSGTAITEASVEHSGELPSQIHLFRRGIVTHLGGWEAIRADPEGQDALFEEIMVTLLHEIGHQMGLDEDDLTRLGYD